MKYAVIVITTLLFFSCSNKVQETPLTDRQVIDLLVRFHENFDNKDFKSLQTLCSEDMKWYTLNGEVLTRQGLPGFFLPIMANWERTTTNLGDPEIVRGGDLIAARYQSTIEINSLGGKKTMKNLQTTVFKKTENGWKIWQHHMSTK